MFYDKQSDNDIDMVPQHKNCKKRKKKQFLNNDIKYQFELKPCKVLARLSTRSNI